MCRVIRITVPKLVFVIGSLVLPLNGRFGIKELVFKKGHIHRVKKFPVLRGIAFVSFLVWRVSQKNVFDRLRVKLTTILLADINKGSTSIL